MNVVSNTRTGSGLHFETGRVFVGTSIRGFSLVELMVVVSIMMILAGPLFPVVYQAKERVKRVQCVNHLKQLNYAWTLYAMDHEERLVPNSPYRPERQWLKGRFQLGARNNPDHVDRSILTSSMLARYLDGVDVYKCPSDRTRNLQVVEGREKPLPWNRSVALNQWMAGIENKTYKTYSRLAHVDAPAERFTFANQRADTLENAYFMTGATGLFDQDMLRWIEFPERYHNGTTPIVFSDGHVETKRWQTEWPSVSPKFTRPRAISPQNPDILWLNTHATSLK